MKVLRKMLTCCCCLSHNRSGKIKGNKSNSITALIEEDETTKENHNNLSVFEEETDCDSTLTDKGFEISIQDVN